MKARLEKSEGFCRDAALGKPAGFTPGMEKLRERGLGGGSHPGQGVRRSALRHSPWQLPEPEEGGLGGGLRDAFWPC